jgi:hypothetical protein
LCLALSLFAAGCGPSRDLDLAAAAGDFPLVSRSDVPPIAEPGGSMGVGAEGSGAAVRFADGSSANVSLGGLYYAASGRWCRRFQIAEPVPGQPSAASTETACQTSGGWQRTRPVVVTGFGATGRL